MAIVREATPIMVLEEDGESHQTYRFQGERWALFTLAIGIALVAGMVLAWSRGQTLGVQAGLGGFAALMFYSTLYSLHADQWLKIDGGTRSIAFHKENFYGRVDWRRGGGEFMGVRVFRANARAVSWSIQLVDRQGFTVHVGENALGSTSRERALAIARKIGLLAGMPVAES